MNNLKICVQLIIKQDDMLRHYKWHKKRAESLVQGFLRFTSADDCSTQYKDCPHNFRQTHYHCLHVSFKKVSKNQNSYEIFFAREKKSFNFENEKLKKFQDSCDKIFTSTSDVQIHSNSHRKAQQIAKEGFQRFKASEDCGSNECQFTGPQNRTTHFHCLRPGCDHSFKNKADMGNFSYLFLYFHSLRPGKFLLKRI